jgi:hypothetical protein
MTPKERNDTINAAKIVRDWRGASPEAETLRRLVMDGGKTETLEFIADLFDITGDEAVAVRDYLLDVHKGTDVVFEEITAADIHFPTYEECVDEDDENYDPYAFTTTYYARRGREVDEAVTTSSGDGKNQKLFFKGAMLEISAFQQFWRLVKRPSTA